MSTRGTRTSALVSAAAVAAFAVAAASPHLLRGRVSSALQALTGADPHWLGLATAGFLLAFACTVGAWRAALAAAGGTVCPRQAAARLGVGSLVNSVAPARLGDALKIALFARAIDTPGSYWTTGGVYAALSAARTLALAALVVVASATGALPLWPVFALVGAVAIMAAIGALSPRWRNHRRIAHIFEGFAALERSPRALSAVLGWTFGMAAARLAATAAVTVALGLPHPFLAALVVLPALDLAGVVPVTPGGFGIGSGAVAVALASRGIHAGEALAVGIAMQAVETLVSAAVGAVGLAYLVKPGEQARRWALRAATAGVSVSLVAVLGVVVFDVGLPV
jgi:uncharacterized membrane protein YbhN (UPF0104 family)